METTIISKEKILPAFYGTKGYTYNKVELQNRIIDAISKIEDWCKENDYRIEGLPVGLYKVKLALSTNDQVSKTQLKKINKYIIGLEKHITMYKSNKFFQLLTETCGYKPVKIKYSEKEEKIQEARKQMLKAKEAYETMLKVYKEEKGDYYKKRMKIQN